MRTSVMPTSPNLLSLVEAAQRLRVSPHTVRFWAVYQHRLPYVKLGKCLRFRLADLEELERRSLVTGPKAD